MNETVTIPKVEYDRLCALEEDFDERHVLLRAETGADRLVVGFVA